MKKLFEVLALFILFVGCSKQHNITRDKIEADINVEITLQKDTISLSSIYGGDIHILALDSIILASVNKVTRYDSLWIIKGKSEQGGVHLFNNEGHYLQTLLGWRQGPVEVTDIYTFETFIEACKNSNYIWGHCNLYEGNRFISSVYNYRNDVYWHLTDKSNNNSNSYKWVKDDLILNEISLVESYLYRVNVQEDWHYFTLSYYDLGRMMQEMDIRKKDNA